MIKNQAFLYLPTQNKVSFSTFFQYNAYNKTFPDPDLTSRKLAEVTFCNFVTLKLNISIIQHNLIIKKCCFVHCMIKSTYLTNKNHM